MKIKDRKALPSIVPLAQWQAAHEELLRKEKAATRARDGLAAERRRLPMVELEKNYEFEGPDGTASLLDLFDGRRQLIVPLHVFSRRGWLARGGSAAITLLLVLTAPLPAQERRPVVALTGGLGNTLGGLGAGVDYYLARSRVSLSAGVGYWPSADLCDQGTLSGAAALRGFIGGRHRGFLELSYSLLAISCTFTGDIIDRHYGPGISAGYRYTGSDGFTFTAAGGIGDVPDGFGTEPVILLSLGYTWQR